MPTRRGIPGIAEPRSSTKPVSGSLSDRATHRSLAICPYDAGISAAYGLPADAALRSVTIDAADILGQADRIGSIDVGKDANLIVCTANPLQAVNDVVYLFINGKPVALESKQTRQARRYARRPKPTLPVEKQLVGLPSQSRRTGQIATDSAAGDPSAQ